MNPDRIDLTPENIDMLRRLAEASSAGQLSYGPTAEFDVDDAKALKLLLDRTPGRVDKVWVTWQRRDDGDYFMAVTGNGPESQANAQFFACARAGVLALLDEVDRLRNMIEGINRMPPSGRTA